MATHHRLFFALWLDALIKRRLTTLSRELAASCNGCWTRPDNLHLTLQFLGSVPPAAIARLENIAAGINESSFALDLTRIEHWRRPRVLTLSTVETPEPLARLCERLRGDLAANGFKLDDKPFRPHVTLARDITAYHGPAQIPALRWTAQEFVLAESTHDARGATTYAVLHRWGLS